MPPLPVTPAALARIRANDIDTLCALDERGIILGENETAEELAGRLEVLNRNYSRMEEELRSSGHYRVENLRVAARDRIPQSILLEANGYMARHLAFSNDWVPGFFLNPAFSLLFGGCAYYFLPDFFALFIIRASFRKKTRWLFYQRQELLAHEICHIARIGLNASIYEEPLAYQTATTGFRRFFGGIFRSQVDSFAFLLAALLLTASQILRLYVLPALPWWPAVAILVAVIGFLLGRHLLVMNRLRNAENNLAATFGQYAAAVLFRCSDAEITELSRCRTPQALQDFLKAHAGNLRWQVINRRFADSRRNTKTTD